MNDYYVAHWERLRHIEGASQRIQEDTQKFATTVEELGASLIEALMTLIAFLPILWGLSAYVTELPLIGAGAAGAGVRRRPLGGDRHRRPRPGRHQAAGARVPQPARRGGLSQGTGAGRGRCRPRPAADAAGAVRRRAGRTTSACTANFLYFNVVRYGYLQASVLVPYIALAPSIVAGGLTLGVMQQVIRAFGRVEGFVPVPGQVVDDDRVADLDLQAPARLRGDAARRAAAGYRSALSRGAGAG